LGHAACDPSVRSVVAAPIGRERGPYRHKRRYFLGANRRAIMGPGDGEDRARREGPCGCRKGTPRPRKGEGTGRGGTPTAFLDWAGSAPSSPACCSW
jgi:hypothetical protein